MSFAPTVISFGEWLPDQAELGNPGLTVATNVRPSNGGYKPFFPLTPLSAGKFTLPGLPRGGFVAQDAYPSSSPVWYYAASGNVIYEAAGGSGATGTFNSRSTGLSTVTPAFDYQFAQFDNLVFAAAGVNGVQYHTVGSTSNFATVTGLTGTRDGRYLAVIGRFLVVANLGSATTSASTLQWSAIDDPTNFPTPLSATATATQSGEQTLNIADGDILGVYGGDQYGIILQRGAVVRMTYVGPPVVFQFDRIDSNKGANRRYASAQAGARVGLVASDGLYITDGVSLQPIGVDRIDKSFLTADAGDVVGGVVNEYVQTDAAFDSLTNSLVFATANNAATTLASRAWFYSIDQNRWTSCNQSMRTLIEQAPSTQSDGLLAFDATNVLCKFNGAPGTAVLTTGDLELNPGGRTFISGIKPNVESSGTAPAVTVRLGSRNDLGTSSSYTATTTPTTRTGFADVRVDAKYHRAEVQIVGTFNKATGLEFNGMPSGQT